MELKPYICERCGGPINISKMKCEYCGTEYQDERLKNVYVEVVKPGVHSIYSEVRIPREALLRNKVEDIRNYSLGQLRHQIADGLLGYLNIATHKDYMEDCEIIRGEVRVLDPMFGGGY